MNRLKRPKVKIENSSVDAAAVIKMREKGMKLREIAAKNGKSIYWVYSRLRDEYRPLKGYKK